MYVTAVNPFLNPYDIAGITGVTPRAGQSDNRTSSQTQAPLQSQERVVQGEVLSRQPLNNASVRNTNDALSNRQSSQQSEGFGFNARQAVNTYIGNQLQGERIDQENAAGSDSLIDVYV